MEDDPPIDETQPPRSGDLATEPVSWPPASLASSRRDRLVAGAMVGTRYRVVAQLGRGGMGEVYRADDLELGQPVALKFLPERVADDPVALDRLRNEVRIARQIAHPNVCRVYDIAHVDRDYYLTMEYVDGEDLASVLRRLGSPSREKALELARQICAGLHAAHELGVLHRDLKPANIMLDGRGRARITDFGLAGLASDLGARREHAGTPAYMAPEQLMRGEVSPRSDLYSLGLILFELFTGKSPNSGKTLDKYIQTASVSGNSTAMEALSTIAPDLDPAVERVVEHCLAPDPAARPSSAMAVFAALPGGDPIAAALAAGETPSPQLVAAGGSVGLLPIRAAAVLLAVGLIGLLVHLLVGPRTRLINRAPLPKPPEVLTERARELAALFGYGDASLRRDSDGGFIADQAYLLYLKATAAPPDPYAATAQPLPAAVRFWYRQSPNPLLPRAGFTRTEPVSVNNPPPIGRGMVSLELSSDGRLLRFAAVAPAWRAATMPATQPGRPDYAAALSETGINPTTLQPTEPRFAPVLPWDDRAAWTGTYPITGEPVRVEAAGYAGKLVHLAVLPPWEQPDYVAPRRNEWPEIVGGVFQLIIFIGSGVLIWVNFAQRRGDPRGAIKVALFVGLADLLTWIVASSRVPAPPGIVMAQFFQAFAFALLLGSLAWSLYMGLEPYIRRRSPYRLVSWSRLLEGRFRDPLVGRDLLIGLACGAAAITAVTMLTETLGRVFPPAIPSTSLIATIGSTRLVWATVSWFLLAAINGAMMFLILPLILQIVLRSWYAAIIVFWLFIAAFVGNSGEGWRVPDLLGSAVAWGACLFALYRYGVVAGAMAIFTVNTLGTLPQSADWSAWYSAPGLLVAAILAALAGWAFYLALGKRSLLDGQGLVGA